MKVVIATPLYPPEIGGPATYSKILEEMLPEQGVEIEVVKFGDVRHMPKLVRHYKFYKKVLQAARGADLVLALDPVSVGVPAMLAAKKARKSFVVKIVGDYAWEQGAQRCGLTMDLDSFVVTKSVPFMVKVWRALQTHVAHRARVVIVPSEYLKKIVTAWGINPMNIKVIYNGIDLPDDIVEIDTDPNEFLIVSSGRQVPWKGFDAISRVAEQEQGWRFFLAKDLKREEALGWVRAADAFVLNSEYEGLAHALIEAMMIGTPIVATRVGGNPELISDGETGLLIPPKDDSALQAALIRIKNDPESARTRAAVAKKQASRYSVEAMIESTSSLLLSI